ncbi:Fibronectin type III [Trinorchestia longiramus]|nr:Fibronectin type III [Trinorchestia longiramus]
MGQFVSSHGDVISHVNISSVRVADGGLYRCMAQNTAGQVHHSARLNVYGPPTIRHMGQLTAVAGETLSVTCPVGGHPVHKITWQKDGVELPMTHQQSVHSNGTLTIAAVTRAGDEGSYSCSAYDKQGRSDTQALQIQVRVPPQLAPLTFMGGNRAGLRAQATCLVLAGDPPISLRWYKDGQELAAGVGDVTITHPNEFSSSLSIERTLGNHAGNYTCSASNSASSASSSAVLTVNVPPTWQLEPSDASVSLGASLELPCSADGFPQPRVTWRKQTSSGNWGEISGGSLRTNHGNPVYGGRGFRNNPPYRGALNTDVEGGHSTLVIVEAAQEHDGRYLCQANNGVGAGLSKLIAITVHKPPRFSDEVRRVEVAVGGTATFVCRAEGDAPLTLHWRRRNSTLPSSARFSIERGAENEGDTAVLLLSVRSALPSDSGDYECQAVNEHGTNSLLYVLLVQDVPATPSGVAVTETTSRSVSLGWHDAASQFVTSMPVAKYAVIYTSDRESPKELIVHSPTAKLIDLTPATRYFVRVAAQNSVGRSPLTDAVTITTLEEAPTGHPRNIKVVSSTARSLRLQWEAPAPNATHGAVIGYYLGHRENSFTSRGDETPFNFSAVPLPGQSEAGLPAPTPSLPGTKLTTHVIEGAYVRPGGVIEVTMEGLRPNTRYALVIRAYNSKGAGPSSPAVTAQTMEDKPSGPPQHVTCESLSSSTVLVKWAPPRPEEANGIITSYRVAYSKLFEHALTDTESERLRSTTHKVASGGYGMNPSLRGSLSLPSGGGSGVLVVVEDRQSRLVSLRAFTNYSVSISAATAVGVGVPSDPIVCSTLEDVPTAPRAIKVVASGRSSAVVSWRPPTEARGRITRYTVRWRCGTRTAESRRVDSSTYHFTVTGCSDSKLEAWVSAHTSVGRGKESAGAVTSTSLHVGAGVWSVGGEVSVAWKRDITLPCEAVGQPEPTKRWMRDGKEVIEDSRVSVISNGKLRLLDAQRSNSGSYTCTSSNKHGSDSVTYLLRVISE